MARVSSEVRELAREISAVKRGLRDATVTPQLGRSSLDDESINTYDSDGNLRARYGLQHDGTYTSAVLDGPVPPVPSVPTVSGGPGELSVTWDGTYVDDARAPMDFHVVEVWAADTDFSDRSEARLLGHFANESGGDITVARPVGEWHVALVSKAQSGRRSAVSERAVAVVESVVDQGALDELDDKIDQAEQDLSDARDRLGAAEGRITDAFGQIDTLGDDVSAASLAAAAAQADASQAISDAQSAQQAADAAWGEAAGKAKSYWSNTPPTPPAEGFNRGDLWHRTVAQGDVAEYAWTGTPDESTSTRTTASGTVTNLFTNPDMVSTAGNVVVWENLARNPRAVSSAPGWTVNAGGGETNLTTHSSWGSVQEPFKQAIWTQAATFTPAARFAVAANNATQIPVEDDDQIAVSIWVATNESAYLVVEFYDSNGVWINANSHSPQVSPGVGEPQRITHVAQIPVDAANVRVFVHISEAKVGSRLIVGGFMVGNAPFYFDETHSPDPDLVAEPRPGGGAQLVGKQVAGVSRSVGAVLIQSAQWSRSGEYSLRIIKTNNETAMAYIPSSAIPSEVKGGTVWRYQPDELTGNNAWFGRVGWDQSRTEPATQPEELMRVERDGATGHLYLSGHFAEVGESVWYDLLTLVDTENYDGPPFSGSTVERAGRQTQVWSGTYWDDLTDGAIMEALEAADAAQRAADAAHDAAGSAQDAADMALQAAGSKSTITYSTSAPAGNGQREGDTHRQRDASHNIIAEWRWTGSAWQKQEIKSEMISNLDVGKLTAGSAEISEVVAQSIAAATAAFIELDVENLFVTGTSTVDEQVAQAIWVAKLAAQKVLASEIATESLAADAGFIGVLNSAEIVGAVIKTAATGARVELDSGHGIRIFNTADELVLSADSDGNLITGASQDTSVKLSPKGITLNTSQPIQVNRWGAPFGRISTIEGGGVIYAAEHSGKAVNIFTSDGQKVGGFATENESLAIAVNADEYLYVGDTPNRLVDVYDINGSRYGTWHFDDYVYSIASVTHDKTFVGTAGNVIYSVTNAGHKQFSFNTDGLPLDSYIYGDELYVVTSSQKVQVFDIDGGNLKRSWSTKSLSGFIAVNSNMVFVTRSLEKTVDVFSLTGTDIMNFETEFHTHGLTAVNDYIAMQTGNGGSVDLFSLPGAEHVTASLEADNGTLKTLAADMGGVTQTEVLSPRSVTPRDRTDNEDYAPTVEIVRPAFTQGLHVFEDTTHRDLELPDPPDGTQAWTGTGETLTQWTRLNGAWEAIHTGPHYLRIGDDGSPRLWADPELVYDREYGSVRPEGNYNRLTVLTPAGTFGVLSGMLDRDYLGVAAGSVSITPSAANTPTSRTVTFPAGRFTSAPEVVPAAGTAVPGTLVTGVGVTAPSATSCTLWLTRTNTTATVVRWVAIEA